MGFSFKNANDQELEVIVQIGSQAVDFIVNNSFWKNQVAPSLEQEKKIADSDGRWKPGKTSDLHLIALINAYNSGKADGIEILESIVKRLLSDKNEALKELERRKEHKEKEKNQ